LLLGHSKSYKVIPTIFFMATKRPIRPMNPESKEVTHAVRERKVPANRESLSTLRGKNLTERAEREFLPSDSLQTDGLAQAIPNQAHTEDRAPFYEPRTDGAVPTLLKRDTPSSKEKVPAYQPPPLLPSMQRYDQETDVAASIHKPADRELEGRYLGQRLHRVGRVGDAVIAKPEKPSTRIDPKRIIADQEGKGLLEKLADEATAFHNDEGQRQPRIPPTILRKDPTLEITNDQLEDAKLEGHPSLPDMSQHIAYVAGNSESSGVAIETVLNGGTVSPSIGGTPISKRTGMKKPEVKLEEVSEKVKAKPKEDSEVSGIRPTLYTKAEKLLEGVLEIPGKIAGYFSKQKDIEHDTLYGSIETSRLAGVERLNSRIKENNNTWRNMFLFTGGLAGLVAGTAFAALAFMPNESERKKLAAANKELADIRQELNGIETYIKIPRIDNTGPGFYTLDGSFLADFSGKILVDPEQISDFLRYDLPITGWVMVGGSNINFTSVHGLNTLKAKKFKKGPRPAGSIYVADAGTQIRAISRGKIIHTGYYQDEVSYGTTVIAELDDGNFALYGNLGRTHVSKGDKIERGQLVGEVGTTGADVVDGSPAYLSLVLYRKGSTFTTDSQSNRVKLSGPKVPSNSFESIMPGGNAYNLIDSRSRKKVRE